MKRNKMYAYKAHPNQNKDIKRLKKIIQLRHDGKKLREIAQRFGVTASRIWKILKELKS